MKVKFIGIVVAVLAVVAAGVFVISKMPSSNINAKPRRASPPANSYR